MIRAFLKLLAFWLIFFFVFRLLFFALNYSSFQGSFIDILISHWKALPMDISAACYICVFPVLVLIAGAFGFSEKRVNTFIRWETYVMIFVCSFVASSDAGLFSFWGTKLNARALSALAYPKEVMPMLFSAQTIYLMLLVIISTVVFVWLFKKMKISFENKPVSQFKKYVTAISLIAFCVVGARGGVQGTPINRNWVFFSPNSVLNYSALNSFWNVADLIFNPRNPQENPYKFFDDKKANELLAQMHKCDNDSTELILTTTKPNIIIILLEGFGTDGISCMGGEPDLTPRFTELAKEGLLFEKCYASGQRTEQGLLAVLSACPSQPVSSIIKEFGKFDKLPSLFKVMNQNNYHTSYYNGGSLQFDNVEAYLRSSGVTLLVSEGDFEIKERTYWGANDNETLDKHLKDLSNTPQPFFSVLSTITTHEFFDANVPQLFTSHADKLINGFRNTMHFTDSCLYSYFQFAKTQAWYSNTVFVITADHASQFPKRRNIYEPERHRIPLLLLGSALKSEWKGKRSATVASQTDIAATLLAQMQIENKLFPRSKNLFNPYAPHFAYYAFDNGIGFIYDNNELVYDNNQQKVVFVKNKADSTQNYWLQCAKAYLQTNFQENINYGIK